MPRHLLVERARGAAELERTLFEIDRGQSILVPALAILGFLSASWPAQALDWERMVMPGPLVNAHAELEKDCAGCHQTFDADAQRMLCLACHEYIAADLDDSVGFHGRSPLAVTGQCRSCHPDHRGRRADILGLGNATFDHGRTDYPLEGRHQNALCEGCHPPDSVRRDTPKDCVECHRSDDVHKTALSTDCGQCHDPAGWSSNRFDHGSTSYPLTGAHLKTSCSGCHIAQQYKGTAKECIVCHSTDDAHGGRFGSECVDCHETTTWKKKDFDHGQESGFTLNDAHAAASCASCHREKPGQEKLPKNCSGCHSQDDVHANRFGEDCGRCHSEAIWKKTRFDHAKASDFPLQGAHSRAPCSSCHTRRISEGAIPKNCHGCHRADDVHQGKLGPDCADCHDEDSFSRRVLFDHELTDFPLLGLHVMETCESCHRGHTFEMKEISCRSCHSSNDVHERTLGDRCEQCHTPNGWTRWQFDHDSETEFALHGAHQDLKCISCHRAPMTKLARLSGDCVGCHNLDDAHRGEFGRNCDSCHSSNAWKPAVFGRQYGAER